MSIHPYSKPGFTRIDLVAALFVAFMAVALLLPGCEQQQVGRRRAECRNNEEMLAKALLSFESANHQFPGYRQELAKNDAGWGVMILPYIDRNDLWRQWQQGKVAKARITRTICPLDPPPSTGPEDGWSSYSANARVCGDGTGLTLAYINSKDGAANTLLLGENLREMKPHTWWDTEPKLVCFSEGTFDNNLQSKHGNGVNVTFCDGHSAFLRDDIGDDVYKALVTPDGGENLDTSKL